MGHGPGGGPFRDLARFSGLRSMPRVLPGCVSTRGTTLSHFRVTLYSRAWLDAPLNVGTSAAVLSRSPVLANAICAPFTVKVSEAEGHTRSPLPPMTR